MNAPPRCPICRGRGGSGALKANKILDTTTYGVPLLASVTTQTVASGALFGVCGACIARVGRKRLAATFLGVVPLVVVCAAAPIIGRGWFGLAAVTALIWSASGAYFSWADRVLWASDVSEQAQVPRDVRFPAGFGTVLVRIVVASAVAGVALVLMYSDT